MAAWWPRRQSEIPVDPLARDDRSRLPGSMPSRPDKYDIAPRPGSVRSGRTPARHLCKTCGVGSTVMFRVRYGVDVLAALAVGAAAGWMSSRGFEHPHQAATPRAQAGHVRARALGPQ